MCGEICRDVCLYKIVPQNLILSNKKGERGKRKIESLLPRVIMLWRGIFAKSAAKVKKNAKTNKILAFFSKI